VVAVVALGAQVAPTTKAHTNTSTAASQLPQIQRGSIWGSGYGWYYDKTGEPDATWGESVTADGVYRAVFEDRSKLWSCAVTGATLYTATIVCVRQHDVKKAAGK